MSYFDILTNFIKGSKKYVFVIDCLYIFKSYCCPIRKFKWIVIDGFYSTFVFIGSENYHIPFNKTLSFKIFPYRVSRKLIGISRGVRIT